MKIYTRRGDDGTTGLLFGGRVAKDDLRPEAYGAVDEAVAALGVARAQASGDLAERLLVLQRQLFVVGAELATAEENRAKLVAGVSLVTDEMVAPMEERIDALQEEHGMPEEFVVPGGSPLAAALDVARTAVRRAERRAVQVAASEDTGVVIPYLNRLADLLWMEARAVEGAWEPSRTGESA